MSTALARRWDFYDDEEPDDLDQAPEPESELPAFADEEELLDADDYALYPPVPLEVTNYNSARAYNQYALAPAYEVQDWQFFGPEADATYAFSEPPARAGFFNTLSLSLESFIASGLNFFQSGLLRLGAGLAIAGLVLALTLNWLGSLGQKEFEIYSFGSAEGSVAINKQSQSTEANKPAPPAPTGQNSVEGKPSITVAKIEEVLRSYNSPAVGVGQFMYDTGIKYNIDPAYALAFFVHESSAGTKGVATVTKSIGNIRQTNNSGFDGYQGFRKYPSWEAGVEDWYKLIRNLYINGWGKRTVEQIIPTYAPAADKNNPPSYINHVNKMVAEWRG